MAPPPDPPPDLNALRDGELRGWMLTYGPALKRYFQKRVSAAEADDLVQEVFLAMHQRTSAEPVDNIQRYLFRVAANVLARKGHAGEAFDPLREGWEGADDLSPERLLAGKQDVARLIVAVRNLPPRTREAFVMHRFEELTYAAIAREMGISLNGVKHLISRAMSKIASDMRGHDPRGRP